ncbi:ROK family protein [Amycolatopsis sp. H20-H5]|uniref:ROK family protein n=1 Tax=Amycolatopsis sp. H20-H5 TaxID=3046309 RepID=UPI002DB90202|nr:ROK family protein [Amycolatopsis sp. H20-H5]MEC3977147.1 ROK family protein [Amycolatopsis sp. H20-H5]
MAANLVAAVDVGGTSVKAAVYEGVFEGRGFDGERPHVVASLRAATELSGDPAGSVTRQVARMIGELTAATGPVLAAGVVVPGIVDEAAGVARFAANLGWRDAPLRKMLEALLPSPVAFGHDVTAGGLAEYRIGAARGFGSAAFVPVGTGIAAALVLDGKPYRAAGHAGELGHLDVGHGVRCGCGATGCLEVVASASALARRYARRTGKVVAGSLEVVAAARTGDPDAEAVLADAVAALGDGLRTLVTLLAPDVVVLGGGLFRSGEFLLGRVRRRLADGLTFQPLPEVRLAELGDEAGCLGAGLLAADLVAGR